MNLRQQLIESSNFETGDNILYQKGLARSSEFEKRYLALRNKEARVYSDEALRQLPDFHGSPELQMEWAKRKASTNTLIKYLGAKSELTILELGCGNGWLSNRLAKSVASQVLALDMNETELRQGSRVFSATGNLIFLYGDIFTVSFKPVLFDVIILASAIQYFPDLKKLILRLLKLLKPAGEIHILDSPLYSTAQEKANARVRSEKYFANHGNKEMAEFYFHHQWSDIRGFAPEILHDPQSFLAKLKSGFFSDQSPFPHLIITNSKNVQPG